MPVNYEIGNINDTAGECPYCYGMTPGGCRFCRKMSCLGCGGIVTGSQGCPRCTGTQHRFDSELIKHPHISLPDVPQRAFAGERPAAPPILIGGRH
jgi:hypothetical protein